MKKISLSLFVFSFLQGPLTRAREATPADIGYSLLSNGGTLKVEKDGRYQVESLAEYQVLSQVGIEVMNVVRIPYSPKSMRVSGIQVTTEAGGRVFTVDPKNIEEKSLSSSVPGYDDTKNYELPVPGLQIGARLKRRLLIDTFKPEVPGFVSLRMVLSSQERTERLDWTIDIPAGTRFELRDPSRRLKLSRESLKGGAYRLRIRGRDVPGTAAREEFNVGGVEENTIWIDLSNLDDFAALGRELGRGFERVLAQPVPAQLKKIFASEKRGASPEAQMLALRRLLGKLTQDFRYFGDWRSVDSAYVPRDLNVIEATRYGDCKDFSVLAVLAARALGIEAFPALVERGYVPATFTTLPTLSHFNHAIARVKLSDGRVYWVDATNPIPHLGLTPADIAGRPALLLEKNPQLVEVPTESLDATQASFKLVFDVKESPGMDIDIRGDYRGLRAWFTQISQYGQSPQVIQEQALASWSINGQNVETAKYRTEDDTREAFVRRVRLNVKERDALLRAGNVFVVPLKDVGDERVFYTLKVKERFSDLALYLPNVTNQTQELKPGSYRRVIAYPKSCDIKSPWFEFRRVLKKEPIVGVEDRATLRVSKILRGEIQSDAFRQLQRELKDCVANQVFVIEN